MNAKKMMGAIALLGLCGTATAQVIANPVNEVLNPGFENGGFGTAFQDWNTFGGNISQDLVEFVISDFASGKIFGNFDGNGGSNGLFQNIFSLPVEPGDRWRAELDAAHLMGDELSLGNRFRLVVVYIDTLGPLGGDPQGNYVEQSLTMIDETTPTTDDPANTPRYSVDLVAPLGVNEAQIVIVFDQPNNGPGAAYFDNAFLGLVEENAEIPFYDGGFETPAPFQQAFNGWAQFGAGFNQFRAGGPDDLPLASQAFEGEWFAFMFGNFPDPPAQNDAVIIQRLPAEAGQMWKASVQARHATGDEIAGNNTGFMALDFYDAAGNQLETNGTGTLTANSPTDVWTPFELSSTAPANTAEVRIVLGYQQDDTNAGGAIWYDAADLSIMDGNGGCNAADLAEPFGVLDLDDVDAFIGAFLGGDAAADIAPPVGVIDLDDVDAFIGLFLGGCP